MAAPETPRAELAIRVLRERYDEFEVAHAAVTDAANHLADAVAVDAQIGKSYEAVLDAPYRALIAIARGELLEIMSKANGLATYVEMDGDHSAFELCFVRQEVAELESAVAAAIEAHYLPGTRAEVTA